MSFIEKHQGLLIAICFLLLVSILMFAAFKADEESAKITKAETVQECDEINGVENKRTCYERLHTINKLKGELE